MGIIAPFPPAHPQTPDVPIVGQPCHVQGFFTTVLITCACDAKTPLMLVAQSVATCRACQRGFRVDAIAHVAGQSPEIHVAVLQTTGDQAG